MQKILLFLTVLTLGLFACDDNPRATDYETSISGIAFNSPGQELVLAIQNPEGIFPIDTAIVKEDGSFVFAPEVNEIGVYRIILGLNQFITVAIKKGDHLYIEVDGTDVYDGYYVEGSLETELLRQVVEETVIFNRQFDSVKIEINHETAAKNGKALMTAFDFQKLLYANHHDFMVDFISKNPGSIASYFLVTQLQPEEDAESYMLVAEELARKYPEFEYLKILEQQVGFLKLAGVGTIAPELNFPSPTGEMIALTSLRGKYVLVDFWASWCRPCREENPNTVKLYNAYHDQGFEVYGYSLDEEKNAWVKAIEEDGITWVQTSDLKGWNAEGSFAYGVQAIPATYLIDPDGRIIAKNIKGFELETKLSEIFEN